MPEDVLQLQRRSESWDETVENQPVILVTSTDKKYHVSLPVDVIKAIIDPRVSDFFIEVIVPDENVRVKHHYLQTSAIAEVLLMFDLNR